MNRLLKNDFYRIFRSKLALISAILSAAIPFVLVLLFFIITKTMSGEDDVTVLFTSNYLFKNSYSLTSNVGIVIPIFASIFVINDLRQGSARNKVICGFKKSEIFFSQLIVTLSYVLVLITAYALLTFLLSGCFFGYPDFSSPEVIKDTLFTWLMGTLMFVFASSLIVLGAFLTKNVALTILITIGTTMVLTIITSIADVILVAQEVDNLTALYMIPLYGYSRICGITSIISSAMPGEEIVIITDTQWIISNVTLAVFAVLNMFHGFLAFKKKDLN